MIEKSKVGRELEEVRFPVDRSKLHELAGAFGSQEPVWRDRGAAEAAGFDGIPVPPTATALADHWRDDGALAPAIALGADLDRVLHGGVAWEYLVPVRAGDELVARSRVVDITEREGKRGGRMTLATVETEFTNQRDELVCRRRDTMIETGEPS